MNYTKFVSVKLFTFVLFINSSCSAAKIFLCHCVKSFQIQSFFWSIFSCIWTEYEDLYCKSPYSVRIHETMEKCLREKCVKSIQIQSFLWSIFSSIWTENGSLLHKSPWKSSWKSHRKIRTRKNSEKKKKKFYTDFALDLQCLIISILNVIFFYEVMEIILGRISWRTVLLINKNDFWYHFIFLFPSQNYS